MSGRILLFGIVVGVVLMAGLSGVGTIQQYNVDADAVCDDRFDGDDWEGEQVNSDWTNKSVTLECTNGEKTETIGVSVEVNV